MCKKANRIRWLRRGLLERTCRLFALRFRFVLLPIPPLVVAARVQTRPSSGRDSEISTCDSPALQGRVRKTHLRVLATGLARVLQIRSPRKRGRREDRVRAAPAVSCAKAANKNAHEHTGLAEAVRPSLRNGFTAYFVLSPVRPELVCHRRQRDTKYHRRLDTGHWGVRTTRLCRPLQPRSSVAAFASIASHPACRDVRNAPLVGWDGNRSEADLPSRSTMICCDTLARRANQKMLSRFI